MTKGFVVPLGSEESLSPQISGTKAASLALMIKKSIPVPPGFCITTNGYNTFLDEYGLFQRIADILKGVDISNPHIVGAVAETIHDMLKKSEMPAAIMAAVNSSFDSLQKLTGIDELRVAVRSSATSEDLLAASSAGQYETFLNVRRHELAEAIKECWLSIWGIKGILYRERKGIDHHSSMMGVLVQAMIPSESAGVVFTASPTGKEDNLIWINAGFGLGEGVVSGKVNSDVYKVDKGAMTVVYREVRKKHTAYYASSHGVEEKPIPDELQEKAVLSDEEIKYLAYLSMDVETAGSLPQGCFADIEWAYFNKRFYILQIRPICAAAGGNGLGTGDRGQKPESQTSVIKTQVAISQIYDLFKEHNMHAAKEAMGRGNITGVSISNLYKIVDLWRKFPELKNNIKTFYANLLNGSMESVNFMKLSAYLPKLWECLPEEFKNDTLYGVKHILKTGNGFSGTNLADIMRYAIPLIEKDLPYLKQEWIRMRVIQTLADGKGMEDASISEVLNIGLKLLDKNIDWLNDAAVTGIKRILKNNLNPISFEDIKKYVLPALTDDKFAFKEDLKKGVIKLLAEGRIQTNLTDIYTGLNLLKTDADIYTDIKDAIITGLKHSLNKKGVYKTGDVKDERIIFAIFKPIAYILKDIEDKELEAIFYRNAGSLLEEGLKDVDADDSILAFKEVLLLASEYTRDRRLETARRTFIEKVYKNLPGAFVTGVDWQSLHNDFEDITDIVPDDLKRHAVDLRDSFHNTLDLQNLAKALNLLNELKTKYPEYIKAIKLAEGIAYWLDMAYKPQVEQVQDSKKIKGLWQSEFMDRFKEPISLYNEFISVYEKGNLIDAIVSHSKIRANIGRILLKSDSNITKEDRLTLYLTDINLERLEQGFSSIVNERFRSIAGLSDLYELSHWINALLFSASRYLNEIEENLFLAERFTDALKEVEFYKARDFWCKIKKVVSNLTQSRRILSLVLFDIPAERIDSFFFTVSPIAAGEGEGYIRIFERIGDERLARVLNDHVNGVKEDEIVVMEYLPEITELKTFPKAFIVEKGSVGSHTAKVAVEFGIPTVRMEDASKRFKEGARVSVKVFPSLDKAEAKEVVYERILIPKGYAAPFYHGSAEGIVRIYSGDVEFLRPPAKREVVALSYLDTKYLDIFAEGDGPCAIIVEKGGELTHPIIVARETMTRLKRTMPIFRLQNLFDILKDSMAVKIFIPEDLGGVEVYKAEG
ncbi:MAG: hypothetical protein HZC45_09325 [Deltaproteobacteria bacterium]|nr:hypothetical protein [Deltaproteobacteria bacterium]